MPPEQHGAYRITKTAASVRLDIGPIHLVWVTPTDVEVEHDGQRERMLVLDMTRLVQVSLVFCSVVFFLLPMFRCFGGRRAQE